MGQLVDLEDVAKVLCERCASPLYPPATLVDGEWMHISALVRVGCTADKIRHILEIR